MKEFLKINNSVTEDELNALERRVFETTTQDFDRAKNSPAPQVHTIFENAGEL
jgi:TPP-dependent pyruvate/acetoin dehydrogenase alpha subunit